MYQVEFMEENFEVKWSLSADHVNSNIFKVKSPQTLLGSFLNILSHFYSVLNCKHFFNYLSVL